MVMLTFVFGRQVRVGLKITLGGYDLLFVFTATLAKNI